MNVSYQKIQEPNVIRANLDSFNVRNDYNLNWELAPQEKVIKEQK